LCHRCWRYEIAASAFSLLAMTGPDSGLRRNDRVRLWDGRWDCRPFDYAQDRLCCAAGNDKCGVHKSLQGL